MKRFIFLFLGLLTLVFVPAVSARSPLPSPIPTSTPTAAPISSFELFWPIVAGKVRGDSLYSLKLLKEQVRGIFIFSDYKKADYNITLSEKRVVEAEKILVEKKDYENAKLTLKDAEGKWRQSLENYDSATRDGSDTAPLRERFISSLEKQRALLIYTQMKMPDNQKGILDENLSRLNEVLAKLQ